MNDSTQPTSTTSILDLARLVASRHDAQQALDFLLAVLTVLDHEVVISKEQMHDAKLHRILFGERDEDGSWRLWAQTREDTQ